MSRSRWRYITLPVFAVVLSLGLGASVIWLSAQIDPHLQSNSIDASIAAKESADTAADSKVFAKIDAEQAAAVAACESAVRDQLKSPATAQFTITDNGVAGPDENVRGTVTGTVDSQNGFGALLRSSWTCTIPPGSSTSVMHATITSFVQH